ncbi:outer membrane protein assembly factor BamB family protein [Haladaptatus halobius]|uniref:outer membrane protein assembly factor BamB family protein n=1 Tax=Haladaptatus halobius TaxID=2884875 RepID=UPI0034A1895F
MTDDSQVYVGSCEQVKENQRRGIVTAFDGETGDWVWLTTIASDTISGIAYGDEMILAIGYTYGSNSTTLIALAATDGHERWRIDLSGNPNGGPVVIPHESYYDVWP